ncbi:MAG: nucleotide sugar dehydrogenase [Defluviimonas denitrificans]
MTNAFSLFSTLKDRISSRQARIATVGLGYVGLPLALTISEAGFPTTGIDLNRARVDAINAGERVISYFAEDRIARAIAGGKFGATADFAVLQEIDVVLICVPTPLSPAREPDLSYVVRAAEGIAKWLRPGQLVVLESTVWPGATATVVKPILEAGGLRAGEDFFLAFSPEREDPGNDKFDTKSIPKIVGADDARSRELIDMFYSRIVARTVPVSSLATAEAVKLAENSFRTVNIALVNEMKVAMEAMGVDVWEVVRAAATKPFGYMPFYPGPGIGGDCIPVSPVYLSWRAKDVLPADHRSGARQQRQRPRHDRGPCRGGTVEGRRQAGEGGAGADPWRFLQEGHRGHARKPGACHSQPAGGDGSGLRLSRSLFPGDAPDARSPRLRAVCRCC